jgi:hypothetical protein
MAERTAGESYFAAMEAELNRERAAVLGRYGKRIEDAIAKCEALRDSVDAGDETAVRRYRQHRQAALEATEKLCVQREMIGVFDHSWVARAYPMPPSR